MSSPPDTVSEAVNTSCLGPPSTLALAFTYPVTPIDAIMMEEYKIGKDTGTSPPQPSTVRQHPGVWWLKPQKRQ